MTKIYLLLGLLLVLIVSFTLREPDTPQQDPMAAPFQVDEEARENEQVNNEYPFLNKGLEYRIGRREEIIGSEDIPKGIEVIVVAVARGSDLYERFGYFGRVYWVEGGLTPMKLLLMEYDLLTRISIRELHISVNILQDFMTQEQVLRLGERLHHGWHLLREMAYPEYVSTIHEKFLTATEPAGWYLGGSIPPNHTMTYRALSETGVGGTRAYGYTSNSSTALIYKATLDLIHIMESNGIQPY